jgi:hypothetical protein
MECYLRSKLRKVKLFGLEFTSKMTIFRLTCVQMITYDLLGIEDFSTEFEKKVTGSLYRLAILIFESEETSILNKF